jgi:hypothetical protein
MLTLERPAAFARLALDFLARHPAG